MKQTKRPQTVDEYIAGAPKDVRAKLKDMRRAIKSVARKAEEKISYSMPYYGYKGRLAYFAYAKKHIGLYVMPPVVRSHAKDLKGYETLMATVRFPLDKKMPIALVKKLVRAGMKNNDAKDAGWKICARGHKYKTTPCPVCYPASRKK